MVTKPFGQFFFGKFARCEGLDRLDCLFPFKNQLAVIQHQKSARQYPGSALVAIGKRMIAGNTKSVSRSQGTQIILAITPCVDRFCEGGLE